MLESVNVGLLANHVWGLNLAYCGKTAFDNKTHILVTVQG